MSLSRNDSRRSMIPSLPAPTQRSTRHWSGFVFLFGGLPAMVVAFLVLTTGCQPESQNHSVDTGTIVLFLHGDTPGATKAKVYVWPATIGLHTPCEYLDGGSDSQDAGANPGGCKFLLECDDAPAFELIPTWQDRFAEHLHLNPIAIPLPTTQEHEIEYVMEGRFTLGVIAEDGSGALVAAGCGSVQVLGFVRAELVIEMVMP